MNRNKQTEILGGIITLIILILLIFLSNVEVKKLSYLESVASRIFNPIQRIIVDAKNKIHISIIIVIFIKFKLSN